MTRRRQQADLLSAVLQAVGCICAVLLAVSAGVSLTLLRQGHFAACLQSSGYTAYVQQLLRQECGGYARFYDLPEEPLDEILTEETVTDGILRRADALWHGKTQEENPMDGLAETYEWQVQDVSGTLPERLGMQEACAAAWNAAVVTPFSAALGAVLQYRSQLAVINWVCALVLAGILVELYLLAPGWVTMAAALLRMAAATAGAGLAVSAVAAAQPWLAAVAETDPGRPLLACWVAALPAAILLCAGAVAAAMAAAAVVCCRLKLAGRSKKRSKT